MVGLTRCIIAIARAYHPDDETLIGHVYDLNAIQLADKINPNFFTLRRFLLKQFDQSKNDVPHFLRAEVNSFRSRSSSSARFTISKFWLSMRH